MKPVPLDRIGRRLADQDLAHQRRGATARPRRRVTITPRRGAAARSAAPISPPGSARRGRGPSRRRHRSHQRRPGRTGSARHQLCRCGRGQSKRSPRHASPGYPATPRRPVCALGYPGKALEFDRAFPPAPRPISRRPPNIVHHRQVLGQAQRMAVQRASATPGRSGSAARPRRARHRQRWATDNKAIFLAVMLAGPDGVEAQPAGLARELETLTIRAVPPLAQPGMDRLSDRWVTIVRDSRLVPAFDAKARRRDLVGAAAAEIDAQAFR